MSLFSACQSDNASGYFRLDEVISTTPAQATESLGFGFTNIYYQGNIVTGQSPIAYDNVNSKCPFFDGSNDNITMTTPGSFYENFTVEIWAKFTSFSNDPCLWSGWNANSSGNYGSGVYVNASGVLQVELARTTWNIFEVQSNTGYTLQTGTVYHIALTTNNANKIAKLYVNGTQVWSYTYTNNVGLFNANKTFRIGSRGNSNWMHGNLDEMAIYYGTGIAPLTQTQIQNHYNAGTVTIINATVTTTNVNGKSITTDINSSLSGTPNYLRPISDNSADYTRIASEGWTYSSTTGQPHYRSTDEAVLDTSDYISYTGTINSAVYWFTRRTLSAPPYDPLTGKGHIVRFAYKANWPYSNSGNQMYLFVTLRQLGTVPSLLIADLSDIPVGSSRPFAARTYDGALVTGDGDIIVVEKELTEAQADLITNYSNLALFGYVYNGTGSAVANMDIRWYWFEMEVPYWQGIGGLVDVTNIAISGKSATIQTGVEISQEETTIHTLGHNATVIAETPVTINAPSNNITIDDQNVDIDIENSIQTESSPNRILITGHNISIIAGDSFLVTPEEGLVTINSIPAQVIINTVITVSSTSISLDAKNTSAKYNDIVAQHAPVHWWKLTKQTDVTQIIDEGSNPIHGTANVIEQDYFHGIAGAGTYYESWALQLGSFGTSTFKGIKFNTNPILNSPNMTIEFWFQTLNTGSAFINYWNNASTGIPGTYDVRTTIGVQNSKVCVVHTYTLPNGQKIADITAAPDNLVPYKYNHVVLTKSTSGGTSIYKSYINGQETAIPLSIGTFFYYNTNNLMLQSLGTAVDINNVFVVNPVLPGRFIFDEFAVYYTALSKSMVQEHYTAGILGPLNSIINAEFSNITFYTPSIGSGKQISVNSSNIEIKSINPIINAGSGSPLIITNAPNIYVDAKDTTSTGDRDAIISVQRTTIDVNGKKIKVSTREVEFAFISKSDISLSAADAEQIENINFGGLLFNQVKKEMFKIGNLSDSTCRFEIFAYSADQDVSLAVSLSKDDVTYSDTIVFDEIEANEITDNIYIKFDVNELEELGIGTFLINVEQTYVV